MNQEVVTNIEVRYNVTFYLTMTMEGLHFDTPLESAKYLEGLLKDLRRLIIQTFEEKKALS